MKRLAIAAMAIFAVITLTTGAWAAGTAAGTDITNTATATYTLGTVTGITEAASDTITVAMLIDFTITEPTNPVTVQPDDEHQALTFTITNTGNATETFYVSGISTAIAGVTDNFDPDYDNIFGDTNNNGVYDFGIDLAIPSVTLAADANAVVFVVNDIPSDDPADATDMLEGHTGYTQLIVNSATWVDVYGSDPADAADPGDIVVNGYAAGVDAIIGDNTSRDTGLGYYVVQNLVLTLTKTSHIEDNVYAGVNQPIPGAIVTYTIEANVTSGSGTAVDVWITDTIPAGTTYVANSLTLEGSAYAGSGGYDAGTDSISVYVGDMVLATDAQTVTFQVTID
ncbi:hypothetical protein [Desulfatibacillum aliphaticivorans]|uniref:hypothetical protein n=1 Tax=Desulfatibacillum aliphaticivorans TaxID=218208 RepID=UPI000405AAB6|nr:hypothetical protein [Desulfatibacillum aliphaticivorans]